MPAAPRKTQTSRLVPTKTEGAHAKAELREPGQSTAPPDLEASASRQQLGMQGAGIWDSEPNTLNLPRGA